MILSCSNLTVGYEGRTILSDVGFELHPGEVVALLGPNGGGKTTLLKTLAGLIPKIAGTIAIKGEPIENLSVQEIARRIGFVPQEEAWKFDFTVAEVVAMGRLPLSNGYFETDEDLKAAGEAMRQTGCDALSGRSVTELSGGERQRVLLARALAQDTPIIFLDEPTAHLDPHFQVGTAALLRKLAKSGKSILVAVHDLPIAAEMADRGILIYNGTPSKARPLKELLESPELDAAYATQFERIVTPSGRLVVLPRTTDAIG